MADYLINNYCNKFSSNRNDNSFCLFCGWIAVQYGHRYGRVIIAINVTFDLRTNKFRYFNLLSFNWFCISFSFECEWIVGVVCCVLVIICVAVLILSKSKTLVILFSFMYNYCKENHILRQYILWWYQESRLFSVIFVFFFFFQFYSITIMPLTMH